MSCLSRFRWLHCVQPRSDRASFCDNHHLAEDRAVWTAQLRSCRARLSQPEPSPSGGAAFNAPRCVRFNPGHAPPVDGCPTALRCRFGEGLPLLLRRRAVLHKPSARLRVIPGLQQGACAREPRRIDRCAYIRLSRHAGVPGPAARRTATPSSWDAITESSLLGAQDVPLPVDARGYGTWQYRAVARSKQRRPAAPLACDSRAIKR